MEDCGATVRHVESWGELGYRALELVEVLAEVHRCDRVHGDVRGKQFVRETRRAAEVD